MNFSLSIDADIDLEEIYTYTADRFGEAKAEDYLRQLNDSFQQLAQFPLIGTDVSAIRSHYRCYIHDAHCIYYHTNTSEIMIVRVLHQSQDPLRQL